jgi:signal transduction histidine kinase
MANSGARHTLVFEASLSLLVLAILILFTGGLFFRVPLAGFDWADGLVVEVFVPGDLRVGDRLIQVGEVRFADYLANLRQPLFTNARPGDQVMLRVERGPQVLEIPWVLPGFTRAEFLSELRSQWWLAFVFWVVGTLALLLLRPKDTRWRLMVAFQYLTALWLSASVISRHHLWESAIILRATLWLSVPVYLHLHWVFPHPFRPWPRWLWWGLYGLAGALAGAEVLQLLPNQTYTVGFLLALLGSLILLVAHLVTQPVRRRDVGLLLAAGVLALALPAALGALFSLFHLVLPSALSTLLFLPLLPLGYFYAAYRRQLAGIELRTNRNVATLLFFLLLSALLLVGLAWAEGQFSFPGRTMVVGFVAALLAAGLTSFGLSPFQRFVERYVFGMPLVPTQLVERYAAQITVSLDRAHLIQLLQAEILPSLLVRQSALIHFGNPSLSVLYAHQVEAVHLPTSEDISALLTQAGQYRAVNGQLPQPCPWVRLTLPLVVAQQPIGLWLLGQRDPDDVYAQAEIALLQSLAHQTAIALTNIEQAERLRALYRADIDRAETERAALARRLHDDLLSQLALLKVSVDERTARPEFLHSYAELTRGLRHIIGGLRPPMLNFGLFPALNTLTDERSERTEGGPAIVCQIPETDVRYDPHVEQHLYRIVQQAVENALRHAQARTITLGGRLEPAHIRLTINDDGVGFVAGEHLDLAQLLSERHFGLAGIYERAALIGARMTIESQPGRGTQVQVLWEPDTPGSA